MTWIVAVAVAQAHRGVGATAASRLPPWVAARSARDVRKRE
jgi:hypothetical protein